MVPPINGSLIMNGSGVNPVVVLVPGVPVVPGSGSVVGPALDVSLVGPDVDTVVTFVIAVVAALVASIVLAPVASPELAPVVGCEVVVVDAEPE
jgi:hypothetical protein